MINLFLVAFLEKTIEKGSLNLPQALSDNALTYQKIRIYIMNYAELYKEEEKAKESSKTHIMLIFVSDSKFGNFFNKLYTYIYTNVIWNAKITITKTAAGTFSYGERKTLFQKKMSFYWKVSVCMCNAWTVYVEKCSRPEIEPATRFVLPCSRQADTQPFQPRCLQSLFFIQYICFSFLFFHFEIPKTKHCHLVFFSVSSPSRFNEYLN